MGAQLRNTYIGYQAQISPGLIVGTAIGSIIAWLKTFPGTPALSPEFVECNGQVLSDALSPFDGQTIPNLNGGAVFLRGAAASGGTGGATTDSHDHVAGAANGSGWNTTVGSKCVTNTVAVNIIPPYYAVVWIMRIK